jgi:hypothetical protein
MLGLRRAVLGFLAGAAVLAPFLGAPAARAVTGTPARPAQLPPDAVTQLAQDTTRAWIITKGSGVTVAVVSSGVDPNAPGLQGKVSTGHDYVSLPYPPPLDGTIVAEAIAGSGPTSTNPQAPLGVAPQAKILSIRVYPDSTVPGGQAYENAEDWQDTDGSAITEAVNSGAKVIYVAFVGDNGASQSLAQAVQYAVSKDVVVIGDEYNSPEYTPNELVYPAALPGVLGVGTVFMPGIPAPSPQTASPVNQTILVGAPGNGMPAFGPDGSIYSVQDDLAAAAWLAGTVALMKSVYPDLAPALVARAIALSARDHPPGGYNTTIGFGLINPAGALQEAAVLAKLQNTATPGPGVASPSARFVSSPPPGVIDAVHHSATTVGGLGGAVVVGLVCLILAGTLARRWRRPAAAVPATAPGASPGEADSLLPGAAADSPASAADPPGPLTAG